MKQLKDIIIEKLKLDKDFEFNDSKVNKSITYIEKAIDNFLGFEHGDDILIDFKKSNSIYDSIDKNELWEELYDELQDLNPKFAKTINNDEMILIIKNSDKQISKNISELWNKYLKTI